MKWKTINAPSWLSLVLPMAWQLRSGNIQNQFEVQVEIAKNVATVINFLSQILQSNNNRSVRTAKQAHSCISRAHSGLLYILNNKNNKRGCLYNILWPASTFKRTLWTRHGRLKASMGHELKNTQIECQRCSRKLKI